VLDSAESQSALLDVLDVLKAADVDDRVPAAAQTIYPSVVQRVRGVRVLEVVIGDERAAAVNPDVERRAADCRTRRRTRTGWVVFSAAMSGVILRRHSRGAEAKSPRDLVSDQRTVWVAGVVA
jgi:hypothetical protein